MGMDVSDLPNLTYINSFPGGEDAGASIVNCPSLQCLPPLPLDMSGLGLYNTGVTCLPNYPAWVGQQGVPPDWPPLCNILNTTCTIVNPLIAGSVFDDQNANGVQDGGEPLKPNVTIECLPGGYYANSGSTGLYEMAADTGTFTVTTIPPLYHLATTPAQTATLTSVVDLDTLASFGIHTIPNVTDLTVDLSAALPPVPGFDGTWTLTISNVGTTTTDANIDFDFDPAWTWLNATPSPQQVNGSAASWSITGLDPGATWTTTAQLNLPAITPLGISVSSSLTASPTAQDTTPGNNTDIVEQLVVGSYDPNDKTVEPASLTPELLAGDPELEYTIRFQNTGTDTAFTVVV
ncbi:MAG TPA: hypothetical protein PK760_03200, partial [Flavobacteriales bacterium]|nr:hypothetical protein [Flavobacteriales bacterium]